VEQKGDGFGLLFGVPGLRNELLGASVIWFLSPEERLFMVVETENCQSLLILTVG